MMDENIVYQIVTYYHVDKFPRLLSLVFCVRQIYNFRFHKSIVEWVCVREREMFFVA